MPFRDTVNLLGVTLDSALMMDRHVTEVMHSCSYHIADWRDAHGEQQWTEHTTLWNTRRTVG